MRSWEKYDNSSPTGIDLLHIATETNYCKVPTDSDTAGMWETKVGCIRLWCIVHIIDMFSRLFWI